MHATASTWRRLPVTALAGTVVWLALVLSRLVNLTRLTLIDVLFLLGPLVIAPLGLGLVAFGEGVPARLLAISRGAQPFGAALAVLSFIVPVGSTGGVLAGGWLVVCALAGVAALGNLLLGRRLNIVTIATAAAIGYMAFGALWLVLSRAGISPLGLAPTIVELTAVHFHFTGFAATLLATLVLVGLSYERGVSRTAAQVATVSMIAGSPVLAAGWGTPLHVLQVVGAVLVAGGVIITAAVAFIRAASLVRQRSARVLLRASALAPLLPMVLAVEYSAGNFFGFPTLDIRTMALIHGDLNALGFSVLGLVAWTLDRGVS